MSTLEAEGETLEESTSILDSGARYVMDKKRQISEDPYAAKKGVAAATLAGGAISLAAGHYDGAAIGIGSSLATEKIGDSLYLDLISGDQ